MADEQSRNRSPESASEVLRSLAAALPDKLLTRYLPDVRPAIVRTCLKEAARAMPDTPVSALAEEIPQHTTEPVADRKATAEKLILYTDGASRGNPGEAGAGIQIQDSHGHEIFAHGTYLGQCTNNVAEYQALLMGLTEAGKLGDRHISIFLDSELIVRQVTGRYKVKNANLKPIYNKVMQQLAAFSSYEINHVPRSRNKRADQLANEGIDTHKRSNYSGVAVKLV